MNREIKFRGWCEDFGEFKMCHYSPMEPCDNGLWFGIEEHFHSSQTHQIMQYTGLKDKNGKEIYEGDIVTFWGGKGKIIYFDVYASFMIEYEQGSLFGLEGVNNVIGNIYENPELLNSEQEVHGSVATDDASSNPS